MHAHHDALVCVVGDRLAGLVAEVVLVRGEVLIEARRLLALHDAAHPHITEQAKRKRMRQRAVRGWGWGGSHDCAPKSRARNALVGHGARIPWLAEASHWNGCVVEDNRQTIAEREGIVLDERLFEGGVYVGLLHRAESRAADERWAQLVSSAKHSHWTSVASEIRSECGPVNGSRHSESGKDGGRKAHARSSRPRSRAGVGVGPCCL